MPKHQVERINKNPDVRIYESDKAISEDESLMRDHPTLTKFEDYFDAATGELVARKVIRCQKIDEKHGGGLAYMYPDVCMKSLA